MSTEDQGFRQAAYNYSVEEKYAFLIGAGALTMPPSLHQRLRHCFSMALCKRANRSYVKHSRLAPDDEYDGRPVFP